ncbi:hypothetical protein IWW38_002329 [Coemansia aciculifera]|uniref:Uncharacterized protein n=1 Tax=Coemansia aciculifera TaxID=417176 RepID=A0ACC1M5I7_9FUNG|nr:hypothetical protein IWW38_002329 [Coemansia aciculifera]
MSPPPSDDPRYRQAVDALVAEYMNMPDLVSSGMIDASRIRRNRLGFNPGGSKNRTKCNIYYEVFGTGPRKLFLIMGMVGCTTYWRLQTRYFANHGDYTICVFDNCGSGRSTISAGPYKVTQLAKDACLVLEHLGWSQDIHMVGVSLGGMIAQEMCLMDCGLGFASVALVDTWHSSTMALPTAKEVKFAFKGMSALGGNPRHLIDLVFSRRWADAVFHDTLKPAVLQNDCRPTNRHVMTSLFRIIQMDLNEHRARDPEKMPPTNTVASAMPQPAKHKAVTDLSGSSATNPYDNQGDSTLHHSLSAAAALSDDAPPPQFPLRDITRQLEQGTFVKREVSGDLHQFMACLGHRLSSSRVKRIRAQNPDTRFIVIHGSKDRVIRPACGRTLAKLLACPVVWIQGAGHMPLIDAHCTFNLILRAFTRDEKWLHAVPDRTTVIPSPAATDDDWIADNSSPCENGSAMAVPSPLPLPASVREMLIIDEADPMSTGRIIPVAGCCAESTDPPTRELVIHGTQIDTPFRIRRYT